eukprot:1009393-Amphidinium_carterae.1
MMMCMDVWFTPVSSILLGPGSKQKGFCAVFIRRKALRAVELAFCHGIGIAHGPPAPEPAPPGHQATILAILEAFVEFADHKSIVVGRANQHVFQS